MRGAMKLAEINERTDFKLQSLVRDGLVGAYRIVNNYAVFFMDHENRFVDLDTFYLVGEDRKRVKPKPPKLS